MTDTGDSLESPPSSGQVCITPPRYETEPHNPQNYQSVYHRYQEMLDFNLESDDEIETVSVIVVDEAGNPVPVTTESVQNEFVIWDEREASQVVRQVEREREFVTNSNITEDQVEKIGNLLINPDRPLKERFRALVTLKNIGGKQCIDWIAKAFDDESALLKHKLAYCLGQLQDPLAIPILTQVLSDPAREPIVRHEAAEALAAIGGDVVKETLTRHALDPVVEVRETCQLGLDMIEFRRNKSMEGNKYGSVDPAPASTEQDIKKLKTDLLNTELSLFER